MIGILVLTYLAYLGFLYVRQPQSEKSVQVAEKKTQNTGISQDSIRKVKLAPPTQSREFPQTDFVQKPEAKIKPEATPQVKIREMLFARDINGRSPVSVSKVFNDTISTIYCFTTVQNQTSKACIVGHQWWYNSTLLAEVPIRVGKSLAWRCWSRFTISVAQIGPWKVVCVDSAGTALRTEEFTIMPAAQTRVQ